MAHVYATAFVGLGISTAADRLAAATQAILLSISIHRNTYPSNGHLLAICDVPHCADSVRGLAADPSTFTSATLPAATSAASSDGDATVYDSSSVPSSTTSGNSSISDTVASSTSQPLLDAPKLEAGGDEPSDTDLQSAFDDDSDDEREVTVTSHTDTTYTVHGLLGQGGFARVMYASTSSGDQVALKVTHKPKQYRSPKGRNTLVTEKITLQRATTRDCSFLMHLSESWEDPNNVYFALPLCYETLATRIGRGVSQREKRLYCAELLVALEELKKIRTVHCDIKQPNILIDRDGHAILTDFGLAITLRTTSKHPSLFTTELRGTTGYLAPEHVVAGLQSFKYDYKVDVWSLGLVFLEILGGLWRPHYDVASVKAQRRRMRKPTNLDAIRDDLARDLVASMLERIPKERASVKHLMRHEYFDGIDWDRVRARGYTFNYAPPSPSFVESRKSLDFLSFRYGRDPTLAGRLKSSDFSPVSGTLLPNAAALAQLAIGGGRAHELLFPFPDLE